jgi:hypothetical protein
MDEIWNDSDTPMAFPTSSTPSEEPPPARPSPLTRRQTDLVAAYIYCKNWVTDLMSTVVDLQIKLARERDSPEKYLAEPKKLLEEAEESLIAQRELKRQKEREIEGEEARLRKLGTPEAKVQLAEIGFYIGREKTRILFR